MKFLLTRLQLYLLNGDPPAPFLSWLNDKIHEEPFESLQYNLFWALVLFSSIPFVTMALLVNAVVQFFLYLIGYTTKTVDTSKAQLAVVITGCDSGFGLELAKACMAQGYYVFACCLKKESFLLYEKDSSNMKLLQVNVTKEFEVNAASLLVERWIKEKPSTRYLHALVNNAGIGNGGLVDWLDMSVFQQNMEVNCFGQIRMVKAFLPLLKAQPNYEDARIINMVSMAGLINGVGMSPYTASKFAAEGFSSALRLEMRDMGVKVITVNPSFHATPLTEVMVDSVRNNYQKLPASVHQDYGRDYCDQNIIPLHRMAQSVTWKASNVTNAMLRAVSLVRPAPKYVLGMDAKTALLIQRLLPVEIQDSLLPRMMHPPLFKTENAKEKSS